MKLTIYVATDDKASNLATVEGEDMGELIDNLTTTLRDLADEVDLHHLLGG